MDEQSVVRQNWWANYVTYTSIISGALLIVAAVVFADCVSTPNWPMLAVIGFMFGNLWILMSTTSSSCCVKSRTPLEFNFENVRMHIVAALWFLLLAALGVVLTVNLLDDNKCPIRALEPLCWISNTALFALAVAHLRGCSKSMRV